jgi:signal transduction histidine kinase
VSALQKWRDVGAPVLAIVLIVLAFVGTTSYVLVRSRSIGESAAGITNNAVPSIEYLLQARSEVALLRVRVERHLDSTPADPGSGALIWSTIQALRRAISGYMSLPKYPRESELRSELESSLDDLVGCIQPILSQAAAGDRAGASEVYETDFRPASRRLEDVLVQSEELNAEQVKSFAEHVETVRVDSLRSAVLLNGVCVLFAAILLRWVVKSAERFRALQASYLRQSQERAQEMEVFAGRVAHDILSPLGNASLALELLATSGDADVVRVARKGMTGIGNVRSIVSGLLEFARAGAPPTEEALTEVGGVAEDVAAGLQQAAVAAGVVLECSTERGLTVSANRGVLASIVTNLVQNAIKHIGDGPEKRVSVQVCERDSRVHLEVHDTGPGVAPDLEQLVFEPYFRARSYATAGLGLGLATVKRLVEAHGGRVGLRSAPGRGSVFWVELPARRKPG